MKPGEENVDEFDRHFARFLAGLDEPNHSVLETAAALLSARLREGHAFLDLSGLDDWAAKLASSPLVGPPDANRPLILTFGGKLYPQRHWHYETVLAGQILQRADTVETRCGEERLRDMFGDTVEQLEAARIALRHRFAVISGGPGTGKTTTVLKILLLLAEDHPAPGPRVLLAAPTGKAAARMQTGIEEGLNNAGLKTPPNLQLPESASTLHRLLGARPDSVHFRHHAGNPLSADIIVIDEASMIDLPLMAKLMDALPSTCRVLLLGDKDQLASVETGYVLGGIIEASRNRQSRLSDCVATLTRNYRFGNESGLFQICAAVRQGDRAAVSGLLRETPPGLTWLTLPPPAELKEALRPLVLNGWSAFLAETDPAKALAAMARFQILTPLRHGWHGRDGLNRLTEEILREEGLIQGDDSPWPHQPLLVTENHHGLKLYNGDTGILLPTSPGAPTLMAWFPDGRGGTRMISPLRLPSVETAFAITVHKSQGSEYDSVLLVLPDASGRVLSRELLYTGLSRARSGATLWAAEEVVLDAVTHGTERASGLADKLIGAAIE